MQNDQPPEFINIDWGTAVVPSQEVIDEAAAEAAEAKRQADATRDYVVSHYKALRGTVMPMEILSIQNLPGHSCLVVNDLLLLSYVEAEQMLRSLNGSREST